MSTAILRAFRPLAASQQSAVTAASQSLAIIPAALGTHALRITNSGTDSVWLNFSTGAGTATNTTGMLMLANTVEVFTFANDMTHINFIGAGVANTLNITVGEGL